MPAAAARTAGPLRLANESARRRTIVRTGSKDELTRSGAKGIDRGTTNRAMIDVNYDTWLQASINPVAQETMIARRGRTLINGAPFCGVTRHLRVRRVATSGEPGKRHFRDLARLRRFRPARPMHSPNLGPVLELMLNQRFRKHPYTQRCPCHIP
jgi:hypothetical protein